MTIKVEDGDFSCLSVDEDTAILRLKDQTYIMDYSSLMDMLIRLSAVASQVEHAQVEQIGFENLEQLTCCQQTTMKKSGNRYH